MRRLSMIEQLRKAIKDLKNRKPKIMEAAANKIKIEVVFASYKFMRDSMGPVQTKNPWEIFL